MNELTVNVDEMRFGVDQSCLIKELSFSVKAGSVASLLGPSGAGKTTLLRIIAGLESRFEGDVRLGDCSIRHPGRQVQFVFQDNRLLPWLTVESNLRFASLNPSSPDAGKAAHDWLCAVGLEDRADAWPRTLSGGEESRVALARVFMSPPELLVLDEPFRNLDLAASFAVQDLLLRCIKANGTTVLIVSHDIDTAVFLSDEVHILTARPMSVSSSIPVDIGRPRQRGNHVLAAIAAGITRQFTETARSCQ